FLRFSMIANSVGMGDRVTSSQSDVDIVIKLDDCWQSDLVALSQEEKDAYKNAFVDATYTHVDFKRDVLRVLTDQYGDDVKAGDKAIAIAARGSRRKADVIAAIQLRRYHKFRSTYDQSYDEGVSFFNAAGQRIANYPKQHSRNLTRKHQDTNNWLKKMVRVLKNLRGKLIDDGLLKAGVAPSYYLEGLLYNVPSDKFTTSYQDCFVNAMNWIQHEADKSKLVCANEQYYLLWDNSHTSWPKAQCEGFLDAAIDLWNSW
ncbi:MAG: nucleotidyltransferase domain-containing protein, partial [Terriglobia bacterium]